MFSDSSEDTDSSLAAALTKNLSLFRWESHTVPRMWLPETQSWFHVFLNMIDECWWSTSPQVPQVSESGQQRPADGCTEHVHHRKCFSRRGRAFKSWCSGKVFSLNLFTVTGELTDVVVGYCISPAQSCQELIDDCLVSLFFFPGQSARRVEIHSTWRDSWCLHHLHGTGSVRFHHTFHSPLYLLKPCSDRN